MGSLFNGVGSLEWGTMGARELGSRFPGRCSSRGGLDVLSVCGRTDALTS